MAEIVVRAERAMAAPAERVYQCIADYREHHQRFLPPAFSDLRVEEGGVGAGTVVTFRLAAGGRSREYRSVIAEPEPGRVLTESDPAAGTVTSYRVTPEGGGSRVRIETRWRMAGARGAIERLVAPRLLGRLYADELERLDRYAASDAAGEKVGAAG
jgi:uncharacterized protein YndB with AHSA1/START domain